MSIYKPPFKKKGRLGARTRRLQPLVLSERNFYCTSFTNSSSEDRGLTDKEKNDEKESVRERLRRVQGSNHPFILNGGLYQVANCFVSTYEMVLDALFVCVAYDKLQAAQYNRAAVVRSSFPSFI